MNDIRFTRPEPGACPKYGDYFIQDRPYGRDVYGNESYQYALYRKRRFQAVKSNRSAMRDEAYYKSVLKRLCERLNGSKAGA